jgi:thioredoxin-like negative regulator of GroEL
MNSDMDGLEPRPEDPDSLLRALHDAGAHDSAARARLSRWLADHLPEPVLGELVNELNAEESRKRTERRDAALARARAALERAELALAQQEAEAACHSDPVSWQAHRLLGDVLERRGDRASALRRYVTAMHLGWDSEEAALAIRRASATG